MKRITLEVLKLNNGEPVIDKTIILNWTNANIIKGGADIFENVSQTTTTDEFDIKLFPEDSILDFKNKIYAATGYFPIEQYYVDNPGYRIEINNMEYKPLFKHTAEDILGIPIDRFIYNSRENIKIYNLEHNPIIQYIIDNNYVIKMVPASNILHGGLTGYELELVYWSIVQFYPYFTMQVIQDFLGSREIFPTLFPSQKSVISTVVETDKCYTEIYEIIQNNEFYTDKMIKLMSGENHKSNSTYISIILLSAIVQQRGKPDLKLLFKIFKTTAEIPIVSYATRSIIETKVYSGHENLYRRYQYAFKNKPDTISFLFNELIFEINYAGRISVLAKFTENQRKDFSTVKEAIASTTAQFLKKIDSIDFNVFAGRMTKSLYIVREITANLIIGKQVKGNLADFLKSISVKGITKSLGDQSFLWLKSVKHMVDNWNEFDGEFLTSSKFNIVNRIMDTKIELRGMTNIDFINFFKFITARIIQFTSESISENTTINHLKLLQMEDPKLYDLVSLGYRIVYARLCQGEEKQPLIISDKDVKDKDPKSILHFWNYTKEEPTNYYCANSNYPYPYFITDYHPYGYCMVCCKKTQTKSEAKQRLHNECLTKHTVKSEMSSEPTRYINIYGKDLEIGRLGQIPDILSKFILYNIENINIIPETTTMRLFRYKSQIYSIDKVFKVTKNSKIQTIPIQRLLPALHVPTWKRKRKEKGLIRPIDVLETPMKNRKYYYYYKRVLDSNSSDIIYIYNNNDKFIILDGVYTLAKAHLENEVNVNIKLVTAKQLKRSLIGSYAADNISFVNDVIDVKYGSNDKEPFYYLYSVNKYYHDFNCSLGYALAAALNMEFEIFIKTTLSLLENDSSSHSQQLYTLVNSINIDSGQENWNEIFYDICKYYNIIPIIFHDENFTKTSTNISEDEPKISLILPERVTNFTQYRDKKFLILLRRKTQDISLSGSKYIFYPIFVVIPYAFFKNGQFERQLFEYDDPIVKIIESFLSPELSEIFDLDSLKKYFDSQKHTITGYFISEGLIFAIQVNNDICFTIKETQVFNNTALPPKLCKTKNVNALLNLIEKYLLHRNVNINITGLYTHNSVVVGIKINGKTFYTDCELSKLPKSIQQLPVTVLNYDPIDILFKKNYKKSSIEQKWIQLTMQRNSYSQFKENIFRTISVDDLVTIADTASSRDVEKTIKTIKKTITITDNTFVRDLAIEFCDPVKRALFLDNTYIFENIYSTKSKNENIYIKRIEI